MSRKIAIFDIDGTLLRTEGMSLAALKNVMPLFRMSVPDRDTMLSAFGCTSDEVIRILGIAPENAELFLTNMEEEEALQMRLTGQCYDGAVAMLKKLHSEGIAIGVCSMCLPSYMDAFLHVFELEEIIKYRRNESSGTEKTLLIRELLDESKAETAVMVGDRVFDIEAARNNGIPSVGCLYGYAPAEAQLADVTVRDARELYTVVCRLLKEEPEI